MLISKRSKLRLKQWSIGFWTFPIFLGMRVVITYNSGVFAFTTLNGDELLVNDGGVGDNSIAGTTLFFAKGIHVWKKQFWLVVPSPITYHPEEMHTCSSCKYLEKINLENKMTHVALFFGLWLCFSLNWTHLLRAYVFVAPSCSHWFKTRILILRHSHINIHVTYNK